MAQPPLGVFLSRPVLRCLLLSLMVFLSVSSWLDAQGRSRFRTAEIRGQVAPAKGETELPQSVTVTLTLRENHFSFTQIVRFGIYSFEDLGIGNYVLELASPGYDSISQTVTVGGAMRGEVVILNLTLGDPLDGAASVPQSGSQTVSTADLQLSRKVRSHLDKADRASHEGKAEEAIKHFEKALKLEPNIPRAWINLSVQYLKARRSQPAIQALQRALEFEPNNLTANFNMSLLLIGLSQFRSAIQYLQRLTQLNPEDAKVQAMLAESYLRTGYYNLALQYFERLSTGQNSDPEWLLKIGDCYTQLGRWAEAIHSLQQFLARGEDRERLAGVRTQIERLQSLLARGT